ncbi:hypothetical protein HG530_013339 [Fusarium avenaceum]|nr:hypothetical protein HG530_013339 [Fusarium avenaceum]
MTAPTSVSGSRSMLRRHKERGVQGARLLLRLLGFRIGKFDNLGVVGDVDCCVVLDCRCERFGVLTDIVAAQIQTLTVTFGEKPDDMLHALRIYLVVRQTESFHAALYQTINNRSKLLHAQTGLANVDQFERRPSQPFP